MKRARAMSPTTRFSMVVLLEFGAEDSVKPADQKEGGHDDEIDEISHKVSPVLFAGYRFSPFAVPADLAQKGARIA
jgi:hypothetical protein